MSRPGGLPVFAMLLTPVVAMPLAAAPATPGAAAAAGRAAAAATGMQEAGARPTPGPHAGLRVPYIQSFTGKPAPSFALKDLQGRTVKLSQTRGKVVLLNFWYSTCIPCRNETPDLITLHDLHKDDASFQLLSVNLDEVMIPQMHGQELQKFLKSYPISFPVLLGDQKVVDAYQGVPVQPISFLLDRAGVVNRVFWGAYPGAVYDRAVRALINADSAPPSQAQTPGP